MLKNYGLLPTVVILGSCCSSWGHFCSIGPFSFLFSFLLISIFLFVFLSINQPHYWYRLAAASFYLVQASIC